MTESVAIIGDIHGEVEKLDRLLSSIPADVGHIVFSGDYVNRGPASAAVVEKLIDLSMAVSCTFLAGNHDLAFRAALEPEGFDEFLRMGGAATVRSYVPEPGIDVAREFQMAVPSHHRLFLESLEAYWIGEGGLVVAHDRASIPDDRLATFTVTSHSPQVSRHPRINSSQASIDTGAGIWPDGLLTCLFWPALTWLQT